MPRAPKCRAFTGAGSAPPTSRMQPPGRARVALTPPVHRGASSALRRRLTRLEASTVGLARGSEHAGVAKCGDLVPVVTKFHEHEFGVASEFGSETSRAD